MRLSLFPGLLCHRCPPRLIRPCSNWPPTVLGALNCVFFPFCVTNHYPWGPSTATEDARPSACLPACLLTVCPPQSPSSPMWGFEDSSGPRPPPHPPAGQKLTLWFLRYSPAPGPAREEGFWRVFGEALEDLESCGQSELLRELEVGPPKPGHM